MPYVLPCVEFCGICESLEPWIFPQGLDDYLYDRGVYGKGYSSTVPVAFKIPKASEALCLDSVHFWALFIHPWSISESCVCLFKGLDEMSCEKGEKEEGSSLGPSALKKVIEVSACSFMM
jgi:hypothetical protein